MTMKRSAPVASDCRFVGSSLKDLRAFPDAVKDEVGHALREAQRGFEPRAAKALRGFGGRGILEIIENHDGNTYRAVYTVRFAGIIYVLHCFQKKSKTGTATPHHEIDVIKVRMKAAEADFRDRKSKEAESDE